MKTNLRHIAKKILKGYPNLEVRELTELIKDQCIREHSTYTHELAECAADREVNKQNYSKIYKEKLENIGDRSFSNIEIKLVRKPTPFPANN